MQTAKMTSKGQVTIPAEIRKKLGLHEGSHVSFTDMGDSAIIADASSYKAQSTIQEFSRAQFASDDQAIYCATNSPSETVPSANPLAYNRIPAQASPSCEISFLDELDNWRKDYTVDDNGAAKALNHMSKSRPDLKKARKIWG